MLCRHEWCTVDHSKGDHPERGWHPDPRGGQRYWDGQKWLSNGLQSLSVMGQLMQPTSSSSSTRQEKPQQEKSQQQSAGLSTGWKVTLVAVMVALLGIVFLASGGGHSQEWEDCVDRFQYAADGSPGNTQKDLESLCETMVGP